MDDDFADHETTPASRVRVNQLEDRIQQLERLLQVQHQHAQARAQDEMPSISRHGSSDLGTLADLASAQTRDAQTSTSDQNVSRRRSTSTHAGSQSRAPPNESPIPSSSASTFSSPAAPSTSSSPRFAHLAPNKDVIQPHWWNSRRAQIGVTPKPALISAMLDEDVLEGVSAAGTTPVSLPLQEDEAPRELLWLGWPPELPPPDVVFHLYHIFFSRHPFRSMNYKAGFMTRLSLPPYHPDRAHKSLVHASE